MMVTPRPIGLGANITLIYYHQRIRLEGYDIEWMVDAVGMNAPVPANTQAAPVENASLEESQG